MTITDLKITLSTIFNKNRPKIIGLMRIRNESLIIKDSLNHLSKIVDGIIIYDDCSQDETVKICRSHPKVLEVIENIKWDPNHRDSEETRHRQALLNASKKYFPKWIIYQDADERLEGDIRNYLLSAESRTIDGIRVKLFDAYLTPDDTKPYTSGNLYNFRKYYGPECREILMIWRHKLKVRFFGLDMREPVVGGKIITKFYCQHYGKSLSIKHWEETCDYYANYFPKYSAKWKARKGKAIHTISDFGRKLYKWNELTK